MIEKKDFTNAFKHPTYVEQFLRENKSITPSDSQKNNAIYNAPNRDILEQKKRQFSLSNADIVDAMNSFAATIFNDKEAKIISLPSFQRKMAGTSNFNSLEMRLLVEIFNLTPIEVLLAFNLFSVVDMHMYMDENGALRPKAYMRFTKIDKDE